MSAYSYELSKPNGDLVTGSAAPAPAQLSSSSSAVPSSSSSLTQNSHQRHYQQQQQSCQPNATSASGGGGNDFVEFTNDFVNFYVHRVRSIGQQERQEHHQQPRSTIDHQQQQHHNPHGIGGPEPEPYQYGYAKLLETETKRRQILQRVSLPYHRIIFSWAGTCLQSLVVDWLIWLTMLIFIITRYYARTNIAADDEIPTFITAMGDTNLDILGGFLSFLLVLFVNQTNTRFFEMYLLSKKVAGRIQDVAGLVSTQIPLKTLCNRIIRYANAAHIVGYVGLGGPYTKHSFFHYLNDKYNLLSDVELKRLEEYHGVNFDGSGAFKELVTWCQREVGMAKQANMIDVYEAEQLHAKILELRAAMDGIYDYCDQPVHFFYLHFLGVISALYLPLFAIESALSAGGWRNDDDWTTELFCGLMVLLQCIFVVGLRLLGKNMIDPFGDDLGDLSVITYVTTTIENCQIIMTTPITQEHQHQISSAKSHNFTEDQFTTRQPTPKPAVAVGQMT